jgi:hypothetical protein
MWGHVKRKWGVGVVRGVGNQGGVIVRIKHIDWTSLLARRSNLHQHNFQNQKRFGGIHEDACAL